MQRVMSNPICVPSLRHGVLIVPKPLRQVEKLVEKILRASISSGQDIAPELLALATALGVVGLAFTTGWLFTD